MSFLPYAKPSPTVWAASYAGSSAVHLGLIAALLTSSVALLPKPVRNEPHLPEYEVTLEILDANIVNLTEPTPRDQLIPPDAVALIPDDTVANLAEAPDQTILTPDAPETAPDPVDRQLIPQNDLANNLLQPDATDQTTPSELTEMMPEAAQSLAPIAPDAPEVDTPDVLSIDDISPIINTEISPLAELVAPVPTARAVPIIDPDVVVLQPETPVDDLPALSPVALMPDRELRPSEVEPDTVDPENANSQNISPDISTPEIDGTPPQSADPASPDVRQVVANPDEATVVIGTLIRRIRAAPSPQCTLALPRRAGPDGAGVSFIGEQQAALDTFSERLLNGLAPAPVQTREMIDQRQCALLDAVRQIADYPAGRIGLTLDDTTLRSGENLRGRVVGAGGLFITLLLIDDNGVVQDLSRFTTLDGNDPVFDAPVARAGLTRATRQIILALGSESGPIDVSEQIGQEAQAVFSALPSSILENAVFGLATFDVR